MAAQYEEIATKLRAAIERGEYPAGSTLPKQEVIAQQEGVSIKTVRAAVNLLARDGVVTPVRRRGTVVRETPRRIGLGALTGTTRARAHAVELPLKEVGSIGALTFGSAVEERLARKLAESLLEVRPVAGATREVAEGLGVEIGTKVRSRRFLISDEPPAVTRSITTYVPAAIDDALGAPPACLDDQGMFMESLTAYANLGVVVGELRERLISRLPTPEERELMALPEGESVMEVHRSATTGSGEPLEYSVWICRGSYFEWEYKFEPSEQNGATARLG
ncbi:GntR family transcriptional regulator [Oerskovia enterophila]|uniref:GntR family transcriptional regulator n=1 Tax=Oerskovia enterophila TaxID=43678 RepID=UPI003800C468